MKVSNKVIHVTLGEAPIESRHRAPPLDDGLADLLVGRRSAAGEGLGVKESLQLRRLLLEIGVRHLVAVQAVLFEKLLPVLLGTTSRKPPHGYCEPACGCSVSRWGAHPLAPRRLAEESACWRSASSSSAAVHVVDQYLATVPSGESSTMSMLCEIWLSSSKYSKPNASAMLRMSAGSAEAKSHCENPSAWLSRYAKPYLRSTGAVSYFGSKLMVSKWVLS